MKIYGFNSYGGPEVEEFLDVPEPVLRPGTVLIETVAVGVNPAEQQESLGGFQEHRLVGHSHRRCPLIGDRRGQLLQPEAGELEVRQQMVLKGGVVIPKANGGLL